MRGHDTGYRVHSARIMQNRYEDHPVILVYAIQYICNTYNTYNTIYIIHVFALSVGTP